ncbi:MAG: response regulator transcription factor [Pseudonocardia sp.]
MDQRAEQLRGPRRAGVVVCAADVLIRSGLTSILRAAGAIVTAETPDLAGAALAADHHRALAVVADLPTPAVVLAPLTRLIARGRGAGWGTAGVVARPDACDDALAVVAAGARVVLSRMSVPILLPATLAALYEGTAWVDPALAGALLSHDPPRIAAALAPLTSREREVLNGIAAGLTNAELARDLVLSIRTIKFHVSNILTKLSLRSREEAIVLVHRHVRIRAMAVTGDP